MTLAIPEDLHAIIRRHNEIKWSEVARKALWDQARKMELMNNLLAESKLSEADVEDISKKIKESVARKHSLKK